MTSTEIETPLMDKIDDLLHKRTTSLRYDKNKMFNKIVQEEEEKEKEDLRRAINQFRQKVLDCGHDLRLIFEKLDLDGNGTLSPDEVKAAFILFGIGMYSVLNIILKLLIYRRRHRQDNPIQRYRQKRVNRLRRIL